MVTFLVIWQRLLEKTGFKDIALRLINKIECYGSAASGIHLHT
jgi:hypothetical protein